MTVLPNGLTYEGVSGGCANRSFSQSTASALIHVWPDRLVVTLPIDQPIPDNAYENENRDTSSAHNSMTLSGNGSGIGSSTVRTW